MPTHVWTDENDYRQGGRWLDTDGQLICCWTWNADTQTQTVRRGQLSRPIDLSKFYPRTDEELREQLPDLALETASKMEKF